MKIGGLRLSGRVFLAPLSGVADSPFRRICKEFGAHLVYSEMISSEGLTRASPKTDSLLKFHDEERPIGIQLFGANPDRMAKAATLVEERQPDLIDLNFSCPARKIVSRGAGCALMRTPERLAEIAKAVVGATSLPVTAKIRLGWDGNSINAVEIARMLEEIGVRAVCVHGRTAKQAFRGCADWKAIRKVREAVKIPVILSGDVKQPEDAQRAFEETGCDALMVGRGSFGKPWIFRIIDDFLSTGTYRVPTFEEIGEVILRHLDMAIEEFGEHVAVIRFRKHLLWYTKGIPGVVGLRQQMNRVSRRHEVVSILSVLLLRRHQKGGSLGAE